MSAIAISGSPRTNSNTDYLLRLVVDQTGGELIKLSDYDVRPCSSCWACLKSGRCAIVDDMSTAIVPRLLAADVVVIGSPCISTT